MDISIHTDTLTLDIYGFSEIAATGDYAGTAFKLSDKMWKVVKSKGLKNKGKNKKKRSERTVFFIVVDVKMYVFK